MTATEIFFLVFAVLGGLALFIFGMNIMTDGLRAAAGARLRTILARTTRNKLSGLGLGTVLGTLVHSSAATVMLVGFVNAGLMTLEQSVPPMLGCNIGTTVSMQAISFKLGAYCYVAIAVGFILNMAAPSNQTKNLGRALMGFGMLFLGMNIMSDAIKPHRAALQPLLEGVDGSNVQGMLIGIGISLGLTAIWQSSGATIGICYALVSAGIFTHFEQVYPIVLGAHIGTCATAMLGSIGTNVEARRTAFSHLFFNIGNVIFAVLARDFFFWLIPMTSSDLIRQTANLHTAVMLISALAVLPFSVLHARLVRAVIGRGTPPPQPSFLEEKSLQFPEQAIVAVIRELQRVTQICVRSFRLDARVLLRAYNRKTVERIKRNENVVNDIKLAMKDYLGHLTNRYLSRRQTILIQHLDRCMIDIERIGDHIDEICDISLKRFAVPGALVDPDSIERLLNLYEKAGSILELVVESLNPDQKEFQNTARTILAVRDEYLEMSMAVKMAFAEKIAEHVVTPIAAMYYSEYISAFDRVVRHAKAIALAQQQPEFWIKRKKLTRPASEAPEAEDYQLIDAKDFLDKLQEEDYL